MIDRLQRPGIALIAFFAVVGCSAQMIKAKGRVEVHGVPFQPAQGQQLMISFYSFEDPLMEIPSDAFPASVNPDDGTFEVRGKDGVGIPPGVYKIGMRLVQGKKDEDRWEDAFHFSKTPLIQEVTSTRVIIVEIGKMISD